MKKLAQYQLLFILLASTGMGTIGYGQELLSSIEGKVYFKSDAPLELIEASSNELRGLIDPEKKTFAFSVRIVTLEGFNNDLQRSHFNENYMESDKFPNATFSGKFIEKIDFSQDGDYMVRAKGKLIIHGIEQERIIKGSIKIEDGIVHVKSSFIVLLEEHGIAVPKIVFNKIAEEIAVDIEVKLIKKS